MKTILIDYTAKREETLKRIGQPYEMYLGKLAVTVRDNGVYNREYLTELIDSL